MIGLKLVGLLGLCRCRAKPKPLNLLYEQLTYLQAWNKNLLFKSLEVTRLVQLNPLSSTLYFKVQTSYSRLNLAILVTASEFIKDLLSQACEPLIGLTPYD